MKKRILLVASVLLLVAGLVFIASANVVIVRNARGKCYSDIATVPSVRVGLLLGTSKYLPDGRVNSHYRFRIDAARGLIAGHKIEKLIISGDNRHANYNEPELMRDDLIKSGVDGSQLVCDYAGFKTLDSVIRAKEVFGQNEILVISQHFHNERAIYIAEHNGIRAIGYDAQDPTFIHSVKAKVRELLARPKCLVDLWLNRKPHFLGPKIEI